MLTRLSRPREFGMVLAQEHDDSQLPCLPIAKQVSGRRVEIERRRRGLSQRSLGRQVGIGSTWVRHLESGDPKVRLEDHMACLAHLGISPLAILLPILFALADRPYPSHLLMSDFRRLEPMLIEAIMTWVVDDLRMIVAPRSEADGE